MNLRTFMTIAGFYVQPNPAAAWAVLSDWAERYRDALRCGWLATYPTAYPFYFKIQRILWDDFRVRPRYVRHPELFEIYESLKDRNVLFASPLAALVNEQVSSGRLRRLWRDYKMPRFSLRALAAPVSIWPNRPDADWAESFARLRDRIDAAFRGSRFDVFIASCGCYGLPICDHVRTAHGATVLYLGNIAHAFFGVRQNGTPASLIERSNPEMWAQSDLGRFKNFDRGNSSRYI